MDSNQINVCYHMDDFHLDKMAIGWKFDEIYFLVSTFYDAMNVSMG